MLSLRTVMMFLSFHWDAKFCTYQFHSSTSPPSNLLVLQQFLYKCVAGLSHILLKISFKTQKDKSQLFLFPSLCTGNRNEELSTRKRALSICHVLIYQGEKKITPVKDVCMSQVHSPNNLSISMDNGEIWAISALLLLPSIPGPARVTIFGWEGWVDSYSHRAVAMAVASPRVGGLGARSETSQMSCGITCWWLSALLAALSRWIFSST